MYAIKIYEVLALFANQIQSISRREYKAAKSFELESKFAEIESAKL